MSEAAAIPDLAGKVLTVSGPVDPSELGPTLMHEHLFVDLRRPDGAFRPGEDAATMHEPLSLANLAAVRQGRPNADNDVLDDFDEMVDEVTAFCRAGGGAIVDVTLPGIGRDPVALRKIARATGLQVVMGAGWYTPTFHPADMNDRTVDDLAGVIVDDIVSGCDDTGIRAGVIGEVGAETNPLTTNELSSVRASARAGRITGAPVTFHVGGVGEEKFAVLDILDEEGVAPTNVIIGHANGLAVDLEFARRVLARGVFIECDFLASPGSPGGYVGLLSDHKVARGIAALVADGYADQMVLGHDICQKIQLGRYGGQGFGYISEHFVPALRNLGVDEASLKRIMVDNPARALAFGSPAGRATRTG